MKKLYEWVKKYQQEIILILVVILISLISFALGYIVAKNEAKTPLKIEYGSSHHWGGNNWTLFSA